MNTAQPAQPVLVENTKEQGLQVALVRAMTIEHWQLKSLLVSASLRFILCFSWLQHAKLITLSFKISALGASGHIWNRTR